MRNYLKLLGCLVEDRMTAMTGVVTSVGFDVAGCVQCYIRPQGAGEHGRLKDGFWVDHKHVRLLKSEPLVPMDEIIKRWEQPGQENGASPKSAPSMLPAPGGHR